MNQILFSRTVFKEQIFAVENITTGSVSTEEVSVVYTRKWSVFNDPNLDQRIIPEDEEKKEALRIGMLVTDWFSMKIDNKIVFGGRINVEKLITYYYTEHTNHSVPLHICQPIQFEGSPMFYFCQDFTKEEILQFDAGETFQYIWRYQKDLFISNIVILPIVSLTGVFGKAPLNPNIFFNSI